MAVEMIRAYVVVDGDGIWMSRPFGSAKAALKNADRMTSGAGYCYTVLEIMTAHEVVKPEISLERVTD